MNFSGKDRKKTRCTVLLAIAISLTVLLFGGCAKRTEISVSSAKLFEVQLSGCNGHGKADFVLNKEHISTELAKHKENEHYADIEKLLNTMTFRLADEKQQGTLTNGQDFTVIADYDETLAANIQVDIKDTELICTARNLTDGQPLDAFQNFKVTFSGENGKGKINMDSTKCSKNTKAWITFVPDKAENLKNGDIVTITATPQLALEEEGFFLKEEIKTFTVKNLPGARNSLSGIDTATLREEMNKEMKNKILNSYYITDYDYSFSSGKKRQLNSEYFDYESTYNLDSYQYIYTFDDLNNNSLIAYYKITTNFVCHAPQASLASGFSPMAEGETDTGITYVAIRTNPLRIGKNNQLDENSAIYFDTENAKSIKDIQKNISLKNYGSEFYDRDFNLTEVVEPQKATSTSSSVG